MSDHGGLRYIFDHPETNARKVRWLALISEFDFEIKYIKGKENKVEVALNKRLHVAHVVGISTCKIDI